MTRVDISESEVKAVIVSRADYETDKKRGFTVLEFAPAGKLIVHNPRQPERTLERDVPATLLFRCMKCKYDTVDCAYTPDPKTQQKRSGLLLIKLHLEQGNHPWAYTVFENPYGNVQDVRIEGVDDYTKET